MSASESVKDVRNERRSGSAGRWIAAYLALIPVSECVAVLSFLLLIWASIWVSLSGEYQSAQREALHDTANLSRTFEDNAQRIVASIDQTLLSIRAAYAANPDGFDITAWEQQQNRPDRLTIQVGMIGPDGYLASSTAAPKSMRLNLSDREHFRVQLDPTHDDLFISKPVVGRGTHVQTVQFSRKLLRPDGRFGGVIVVSLGCDELSKFYQATEIGGFVLLAGIDGIVRARGPLDKSTIGIDLHTRSYFADALKAHQGNLEWNGPPQSSFLSFRHLENYPLLVIVGLDKDHVFADYYVARIRWIGIGLVVTIALALLGMCWIVQRRRFLASKRALKTTLDSISQGIAMVDARGRVPVMNQRAAELLEMPLAGPDGSDVQLARRLESIGAAGPDASGILQRGSRMIEVQNHPTPFGDSVLTYTDVTERRQHEARILQLALHDGLTGLANRVLLAEKLSEATSQAGTPGSNFALLAIDLDGFKGVNDGLGHDVGDLVLVRVSERLLGTVRAGDTVARVGGDEFAILVRNIAHPELAEQIAAELVHVLAEPIDVAGHTCTIGASVGIAFFPFDGILDKELIKSADLALYTAKSEGRGQYRRFEKGMCSALQERRWLERELRIAVELNQLELHFQPQLASDTMAVVGFEALARWHHPERGYIPPEIFIPVAEECGLVIAIGRAALEEACTYAATWHPHCRVAVNLSPVQFRDTNLPAIVAEILCRTGLPADLLELEVTEGVLIRDEDQALRTLSALRDLGVRIALDDFGTGFSSLSYLRCFPFDRVKIDKSFVQAQEKDPRARAILSAVLAMSSALDLSVTAEGVETEEQLEALRSQGCTEVQGFLLGRPMPAQDIGPFIAKIRTRASSVPVLYVATEDGARRAMANRSEPRAA